MKPVRCPRCGGSMRMVEGSDRTVKGGEWYVIRCDRCLFSMDEWRPRRTVKQLPNFHKR